MVTHVFQWTCGESTDLVQEKPVKTRGSRHWCITELMRHRQPVTADTRMCLMLPPYYSGSLPQLSSLLSSNLSDGSCWVIQIGGLKELKVSVFLGIY